MQIGGIEVKRRVWVSLLFAGTAVGSWWLWTGSAIPVAPAKIQASRPSILLAPTAKGSRDSALREQAEYMDPTPLFFPTKWNYGQGGLRDSVKPQPGQIFGWIEPKFVFSDQDITSHLSEPVVDSIHLADVVKSGNEAPFAGIGESDTKPFVLPERGGFLEVTDLRNGKTVIAQKLGEIPGVGPDFTPAEFLVSVGRAGLVASPVLMGSTGREETENILRTYLAKSFRVGERLAPGMYRILIGP